MRNPDRICELCGQRKSEHTPVTLRCFPGSEGYYDEETSLPPVSSKCVTRLPEEPSCPSCERTREIIAARLNQAVTNEKPEVADALREILEAIRTP